MTTDGAIDRGIARQLQRRRSLLDRGVRAIGWKAAFGAPAAQERLGLDGPLLGFMTEETVLSNGATVDVSDWTQPLVEPELAVWLSADLEGQVSENDVLAAIGPIGPAIEVADPASEDVEEALAESGFHRGVVLGEARAGLDIRRLAAEVVVDGSVHTIGDVEEVTGSITAVIAHLCRHLARHEERLSAGEVIICGAMMPAISFVPGTIFEYRLADLTNLAPLSLTASG